MKTVFVVMKGEICEGGSIVSIHSTKRKATMVALAVKTCFEGGWVPDGEDVWINGCDFVEVVEKQINE